MFEWLAANAGIRDKAVSLSVTAGGYRGLLADGDIAQGQASPAARVIMWSHDRSWFSGDQVCPALFRVWKSSPRDNTPCWRSLYKPCLSPLL